jgi:hypothetical protein
MIGRTYVEPPLGADLSFQVLEPRYGILVAALQPFPAKMASSAFGHRPNAVRPYVRRR